jgi:heterodisulfide reductase subunit B
VSLDWQGKLECCGAALAGLNDELAGSLLNEKVAGALRAGADYITPICSYCHLQFDTAQQTVRSPDSPLLPVLLYPQVLGLVLGIDEKLLGIDRNSTIAGEHLSALRSLLGPPVEEKKKKRKKAATAKS